MSARRRSRRNQTITGPPPAEAALGFGPAMADRLRIGVSACLLGRQVRFDGQHKRDAFLVDALGRFAELVPVCPEVEVGMSIPREPVRLVGAAKTPRMLGQRSEEDDCALLTSSRIAGGRLARKSVAATC